MGIELTSELVHALPNDLVISYRVIPKAINNDIYELYCDQNIAQHLLVDELTIILGKKICLDVIDIIELDRLLSTYYFLDSKNEKSHEQKALAVGEDFLNTLINEAKSLKSSDIHIETYEQKCRIRIRIDGMMVERYLVAKSDYPALINKVKILANLDIAEKRLPQDGRIHHRQNKNSAFDIRVSVLPTLHGEKVVLRLLNNSSVGVELDVLGLSPADLNNYLQGVKQPNGIILISGPTGSGKTTTLYATLKLLNKATRNILTIEDPIEYTLEGINQVQLKESIGLSFASALRTFLRQDPDVIMVGEIRDPETANMAIRAALTGHLVLSTIHTNSAWGTVSRLIDMGIPSFLVANTLNTSVAQRLLRMLCPACKAETSFDETTYPSQFSAPFKVAKQFVPNGCAHCFHTGYKGRKAVYEVIPIDRELAYAIKQGNMEISEQLKTKHISTLGENAFELFASGETSLEEVFPLLLSNS
ncbi:type II/IV secretion system protein [Pedobacter sp. LMG 31464]|uniref:Type II/IV secretion system protein n=1 Tax=Pedobacter planticolens TaxID=2679964 RepID=A0A923IVF6_9SPHI|nr:GspE/PulE family protein [Pedobacter planticolens]MBB2143997.1 type II/IV secretion system protein [Pedobacter planticolens]